VDTKKILALSDSHGNISALTTVLKWAKNHAPDLAVFLGDGVGDVEKAETAAGFICEWKIVRGNNDWGFSRTDPESAVFDFGGHRFFISHGHRYGLHWGDLTSFIAAARNNGADIALFGHTHAPFQKNENGLLLLNPGSIARARCNTGSSFALIECSPDVAPKINFFSINSREGIANLSL
jgi:hypothetical protein